MSETSRRTFFRRSASLLTAMAAARCAPADAPPVPGAALDEDALRALARVVLPSELGEEGQSRVVAAFREWTAEFEPVAEQNHGYGSAEIRYGPPDPSPNWRAQLEALDLEAQKRHGRRFAELPAAEAERLVRARLEREAPERLPAPTQAPHVALGLLAFFYETPEATDLCYRAAISPTRCRGLAVLPDRPQPLNRSA